MAIASPGIGSNLDVNSIVSSLMSLERQPLDALSAKEASYQAKLTAYGTLNGALASFQSSVAGVNSAAKFNALKATPADASIATASASSTAVPGSYALEVSQLAQSQKLVSTGQADTTTAIGTGTLTFDFGTISGGTFDALTGKYTGAGFASNGSGSKTVTIDSSNNTLSGIRDAINTANIGVTATIINDGSGNPYRLALTSTSTGEANSIKISGGDAGLSALLGHDPANDSGQNLSQTVTAQNAAFKVDGVSITKSSNTTSDVIQGVTLNLLKTNAGSPTTISVSRDSANVKSSVDAFVKAYNDANKTLSDLSAYDATTKQAAILQGDSTVRTIQYQLRNTLNTSLAGNASYTSLSQIGISFQKDGSLAVDSTKLQSAIDNNPEDIAGVFAAAGKSTDSMVSYAGSTTSTKAGTYAVSVSQLATHGNSAGTGTAGLTIDASNNVLELSVDGVAASITLASGSYTADTLAAELQSKINGAAEFLSAGVSVKVTQSAGVLTVISDRYGSASNVNVTGGNAQANLALGAGTAGLDVAGTINGQAATGSGQYLTGSTGNDTEGLKLLISGGITGARGSVYFSKGYAYQLNNLVDGFLGSSGTISSRTDGINSSITDIGKRRDVLERRLVDIEKRYRAQYTALDTLISSMRQTSDYLTQQLANLPGVGS